MKSAMLRHSSVEHLVWPVNGRMLMLVKSCSWKKYYDTMLVFRHWQTKTYLLGIWISAHTVLKYSRKASWVVTIFTQFQRVVRIFGKTVLQHASAVTTKRTTTCWRTPTWNWFMFHTYLRIRNDWSCKTEMFWPIKWNTWRHSCLNILESCKPTMLDWPIKTNWKPSPKFQTVVERFQSSKLLITKASHREAFFCAKFDKLVYFNSDNWYN